MRLILIRHGDPDYANDTLTEKGEREARLLAGRISGWKMDEIYCSPLGRAKKTAQLALGKRFKETVILDWMQEFTGRITDPESDRKRIPWDLMPGFWTGEERFYGKDSWGEPDLMRDGGVEVIYQDVCQKLDLFLEDHGYRREGRLYRTDERAADQNIVIFAHMGINLVFMSHLLGISPVLLWQGFFLSTTSVTVLGTDERVKGQVYFRCQASGSTTHLYDGGEPVSRAGYFTEPFQG